MPPLRTDQLPHPETPAGERITRPFHVGLRNSLRAVAAVGVGGIVYLIRYPKWSGLTVWWVWGAVAAGAVAVCFGHAYLGTRISGRRAHNFAILFLLGGLVGLVLWLKHAIDAGR